MQHREDLKGSFLKKEDVEPILIIEPPLFFFKKSTANFVIKNVPFKLTSIVFFQSLKSISSNFAEEPDIPALLISASIFLFFSFISLKKL